MNEGRTDINTSSCADTPWKKILKNESFANKLVTRKVFVQNPMTQSNENAYRRKAENSMISKLFINDRMSGVMISFFSIS